MIIIFIFYRSKYVNLQLSHLLHVSTLSLERRHYNPRLLHFLNLMLEFLPTGINVAHHVGKYISLEPRLGGVDGRVGYTEVAGGPNAENVCYAPCLELFFQVVRGGPFGHFVLRVAVCVFGAGVPRLLLLISMLLNVQKVSSRA